MEHIALSKVNVSLKSNVLASAMFPALNTRKSSSHLHCLDPARVFGLKGVRVSSSSSSFCQSGFRGVSGMRVADGGGLTINSYFSRKNKLLVAVASHEESAASDIEVEKVKTELEKETQESEEAWKQTMDVLKEQASRMQEISKEAYAVYGEKAKIILKDTAEQLKLQAEKAKEVLTLTAEEISEQGKQDLSAMLENAPEQIKDIAETAFGAHPEDLKKLTKIHDFCLGIPYGALLFGGGFLSFLVTGSIPAVRFGIILGGIHLALSSSSLRAWKKGTSSQPYVKGQAAIALIIFVREMRVLFQRPVLFPGVFMTFIRYICFGLLTGTPSCKNDMPRCNGQRWIFFKCSRKFQLHHQCHVSVVVKELGEATLFLAHVVVLCETHCSHSPGYGFASTLFFQS